MGVGRVIQATRGMHIFILFSMMGLSSEVASEEEAGNAQQQAFHQIQHKATDPVVRTGLKCKDVLFFFLFNFTK